MEMNFEAPPEPIDPLMGSTIELFMGMVDGPNGTHGAHGAGRHQAAGQPGTNAFRNQEDSPACPSCGAITVRSGACYTCLNCGSTSGCG